MTLLFVAPTDWLREREGNNLLSMLVNLRTYKWSTAGSNIIWNWDQVTYNVVGGLTNCTKLRSISLPAIPGVNWLEELHQIPFICYLTLHDRRYTYWRQDPPEEKPKSLSAVQRAVCARLRSFVATV